jgi:Arc/MetJ-type ribon-helix-helix transcriptional regulator
MISIDLPTPLEKHFWEIVQDGYDGDLQAAIRAFLKLHEKYGWKEQLLEDIESIRSEVRRKGGIKSETIDDAIKRYRKSIDTASG